MYTYTYIHIHIYLYIYTLRVERMRAYEEAEKDGKRVKMLVWSVECE